MFIYQKNKLIIKDLKKIILLKDTQIIVKTNQHNIIIKGNELTLGYFECFEKMFTKEQKSHITELRFIDKKELEFLKGRKIKYTNYGVRISCTSRYILNEKSIIENFKAYHNAADRDTLLELRFEGSFAGMCLPVVVIDK